MPPGPADTTPTEAPIPPTAPDRLSTRGRNTRVAVSLVVGTLLVVGTFWGSDDSFPFGPFRMYAMANKPDGAVFSTRMEAIDVTGRRFKLNDDASGLRRAELEGQLTRFQESPELLAELAGAYEQRNPGAPPVARVEVYRRIYDLEDGQPTGEHVDRLMTSWDVRELSPEAAAEVARARQASAHDGGDGDGDAASRARPGGDGQRWC